MRKPKVKNKYNLTPAKIKKMKFNRELINNELFWRNDVISAWCLSGNTAKCSKDYEFCTYNEFWLGIYDDDAKAYAGKIRLSFSCYGGMGHYNFKKFYDFSEIENEDDLAVQELCLKAINELIDKKILYFE